MSHPGNDERIDSARDEIRDRITTNESRMTQINRMVYVATEMGISVVQEIITETLKRKPGCSVKDFAKILDEYVAQQKVEANKNDNLS